MLRSGSHDGVDLEVFPGAPGFHDLRSFRNVPFAGQSTTAVVGAVALAPPAISCARYKGAVALAPAFACLAQVPPQPATHRFIAPDVLIDRLVAQAALHQSKAPDVSDDLLGRQVLAQQLAHQGEVAFGVVPVAPGAATPGHRLTMRTRIAIAGIVAVASVSSEFSPDGAAVASYLPADLGQVKALR